MVEGIAEGAGLGALDCIVNVGGYDWCRFFADSSLV